MQRIKPRRDFLKLGGVVGAGLAAAGPPALALAGENDAEMPLFEAVRRRRSVRKFRPDPVPAEHVEQIIRAACLAPTSGNQQPWKFLVVDDPARIEDLKRACIARSLERFQASGDPTPEQVAQRRERAERSFGDYLSAPVYVVVLTSGKSRYPDYNHWDGPLAAANLMLAARALGYGTVFITDSIPDEVTREVFAIPEHLTRVCITPIGVPVEWPGRPAKKPWRSFVQRNSF